MLAQSVVGILDVVIVVRCFVNGPAASRQTDIDHENALK